MADKTIGWWKFTQYKLFITFKSFSGIYIHKIGKQIATEAGILIILAIFIDIMYFTACHWKSHINGAQNDMLCCVRS